MPGPFLINNPPTNIDELYYQSANQMGPFRRGDDLYVAVFREHPTEPDSLRMYKSTNGGQTWTEQDAANLPLQPNDFTTEFAPLAVDADHIWLLKVKPSLLEPNIDLQIVPFNMATDQWEAIINDPTLPENAGVELFPGDPTYPNFVWAQRSNGDIVLVLSTPHETVDAVKYSRLSYSVWNGQSWSAAEPIEPAAGQARNHYLSGLAIDGEDRAYFFYFDSQDFFYHDLNFHREPYALKLRTLTAGGALSSIQTIVPSGVLSRNGWPRRAMAIPVIYNDGGQFIGLSRVEEIYDGFGDRVGYDLEWLSAAIADSPAWTIETVFTHEDIALNIDGNRYAGICNQFLHDPDTAKLLLVTVNQFTVEYWVHYYAFDPDTPAPTLIWKEHPPGADDVIKISRKIGGVWTAPQVLMTLSNTVLNSIQITYELPQLAVVELEAASDGVARVSASLRVGGLRGAGAGRNDVMVRIQF